jgi:DNA modification methylase
MTLDLGNYARSMAAFDNTTGITSRKKKSSTAGDERFSKIPLTPGDTNLIHADARSIPLPDSSVDIIVTSPPYWQKRDYGYPEQIGLEKTPQEFVANILTALREWRRVLKPTGSVFLNMGDTYLNKSLAGIPGRIEGGMPEPSKTRLANRHEYILHFSASNNYYYDIVGYSEKYGNGANPGDVWNVALRRDTSKHLAPFPEELVERAITLACPQEVCSSCGHLRARVFQRTAELDPARPQARRAMELARQHNLTPAQIAAIQAGTGKNTNDVKRLAAEAKEALGGYFREFTFAKKKTVDWTRCSCNAPFNPAVVLDPFAGTGTTLRVASAMNRVGVGIDLAPKK